MSSISSSICEHGLSKQKDYCKSAPILKLVRPPSSTLLFLYHCPLTRVCNMVTRNPRTREKNSWKQAQGGTDLRFWDYRFPEPEPKRSRSHIVFLRNFLCTQTLPFSWVLGFPVIRVWDFSRVSRVSWTLKCSIAKICSSTGMCSITGPIMV